MYSKGTDMNCSEQRWNRVEPNGIEMEMQRYTKIRNGNAKKHKAWEQGGNEMECNSTKLSCDENFCKGMATQRYASVL